MNFCVPFCDLAMLAGSGKSFDGYEDFQSYTVENPLTQTLSGGLKFTGSGVYRSNYMSVQGNEDFEGYSTETFLTQTLNLGTAYTGSAVYRINYTGLLFADDFESYSVENPLTQSLVGYKSFVNGNNGFSAAAIYRAQAW